MPTIQSNNPKSQKRLIAFTRQKYAQAFPFLFEERVQASLTITLTLFAIAILGIFAINPTVTTIIQLQRQLEDNKQVLGEINLKLTNLGLLQRQYVVLQKDIPTIDKAMPKTPTISQFIGQMQSLAGESELTINRVQTFPLDITNPGTAPYQSVTFSLFGTGTRTNINTFVEKLMKFDRIVTLDSISISSRPDNTTGDALLVDVKGRIYFQP